MRDHGCCSGIFLRSILYLVSLIHVVVGIYLREVKRQREKKAKIASALKAKKASNLSVVKGLFLEDRPWNSG